MPSVSNINPNVNSSSIPDIIRNLCSRGSQRAPIIYDVELTSTNPNVKSIFSIKRNIRIPINPSSKIPASVPMWDSFTTDVHALRNQLELYQQDEHLVYASRKKMISDLTDSQVAKLPLFDRIFPTKVHKAKIQYERNLKKKLDQSEVDLALINSAKNTIAQEFRNEYHGFFSKSNKSGTKTNRRGAQFIDELRRSKAQSTELPESTLALCCRTQQDLTAMAAMGLEFNRKISTFFRAEEKLAQNRVEHASSRCP